MRKGHFCFGVVCSYRTLPWGEFLLFLDFTVQFKVFLFSSIKNARLAGQVTSGAGGNSDYSHVVKVAKSSGPQNKGGSCYGNVGITAATTDNLFGPGSSGCNQNQGSCCNGLYPTWPRFSTYPYGLFSPLIYPYALGLNCGSPYGCAFCNCGSDCKKQVNCNEKAA